MPPEAVVSLKLVALAPRGEPVSSVNPAPVLRETVYDVAPVESAQVRSTSVSLMTVFDRPDGAAGEVRACVELEGVIACPLVLAANTSYV